VADLWLRAEAALTGEGSSHIAGHPARVASAAHEAAPGILFCEAFANVAVFATGDGLLMVDSGTVRSADWLHGAVREWSRAPVRYVVFTHGHVDHVMGVAPFDREAEAAGRPRPQVVAHEAVLERFEVYRRTAGYNGLINHRQFGTPPVWPMEYRLPDRTHAAGMQLELGGQRFELRHSRGETDDQTWVWAPGRGAVCCGDLFIGLAPNAGNPQKRQRFALEWAAALREIMALEPELVLPGHGLPLRGRGTIARVLGETAEWLESLHEQVVALMNGGSPLDEIVRRVEPPPALSDRPYLRALYDEPEFVVRNIWRRYGGWWDGNPARLKPPPDADVASEVSALAGGVEALSARAQALLQEGKPALAAQLAEWAVQAAPDSAGAHAVRTAVYRRLAEIGPSLMARAIFGWASRRSSERSEQD
jgi:glyoxylase-like metal-dependent hydrolase (beta-lactamase superfamily II)